MKLHTKFIVIIFLIAVIFTAGFSILRHFQIRHAESVFRAGGDEKQSLFDKIVALKGETLRTLAYDYTFWDEMVDFAATGDRQWASENIDTGLKSFNVQSAWIYRPDFSLVYSSGIFAGYDLKEIPVPKDGLTELFSKGYFPHFFIDTPDGPMEIRGAPVQPTSDSERATPPKGYFLAGRLWSKGYIKEISGLTESSIVISRWEPDKIRHDGNSSGKKGIVFYRTLNGWDGKPLFEVMVHSGSPVVAELNRFFINELIFVSAFLLSVVAILAFFIMRWVTIPLKTVSGSLKEENLSLTKDLCDRGAEFSLIAGLIDEFHGQKKELVREVRERRKIASELAGVNETLLQEISERKKMEEELKRLATTDKLTGAYNRMKFEEIIEREIGRVRRYSQPLSMMMFDIDYFKKVNDTYGHSAGDYVLKTVADIVRENIRKIDYLVRWGGDEFMIISSETGLDDAYALADRIKRIIESYHFDRVGKITVSMGVTAFRENDVGDTFIKRADDAMYVAKSNSSISRVEVIV
jgi:diguanylate cyclase (GGDEF)-like protein